MYWGNFSGSQVSRCCANFGQTHKIWLTDSANRTIKETPGAERYLPAPCPGREHTPTPREPCGSYTRKRRGAFSCLGASARPREISSGRHEDGRLSRKKVALLIGPPGALLIQPIRSQPPRQIRANPKSPSAAANRARGGLRRARSLREPSASAEPEGSWRRHVNDPKAISVAGSRGDPEGSL